MTTVFITAKGSIYTNGDDFEVAYSTTGGRFTDRQAIIDHGLDVYGNDDFNIATLVDGKMTAFGWGLDDFPLEDADLPDVARQLGLEVAA